MDKVSQVFEKLVDLISQYNLKPGEIAALAKRLNDYVAFKRSISAYEKPEVDTRAIIVTRVDAKLIPVETIIGEPVYTDITYQGRWVLDMMGRVDIYYLNEVDRLKKGMIDMGQHGNSLADLLRHISYTVSRAPKARLIDELQIISEFQAGSSDLKLLAGELLKRLDALELSYKQLCGGVGFSELVPDGYQEVVAIHKGIEALIGTDDQPSDKGKRLQEAVARIDDTCKRILDFRADINRDKGKWARSDRLYKQCIYKEAQQIIKENAQLEGKNTAIGQEIIARLSNRERLNDPESTALYNLKDWKKNGRLSREMYDLLNDPKNIPSDISRYSGK